MISLTENARTVLKSRYLLKDERGKVCETPDEMFRRVAKTVAAAETAYGGNASFWENVFYHIMSSLRFLPNSPTLMNAGKTTGQLAACFVLPVEDSMRGIFDTLKNAALILQSGGGTGFSFSSLRPRDDIVHSTGGIASGPVSFMKIYNTATDVIKQGGARRGANMGILRIDHPDILEFIRLKKDNTDLANFNISVAVTDNFMDALRGKSLYLLKHPRTHEMVGQISARQVFDELVESAWRTGDPGIIFIDRINRDNPTPQLGSIESTNPCGEQPLLPYEACILGSLNIAHYVRHSILVTSEKKPEVNLDDLEKDIRIAVRFLDNCIDVNTYPLPEIKAMHRGNRKIGLGVMGWADMLILMGIPYNSEEALRLADHLMSFIRHTARDESAFLGSIRGVFPNFEGSVYDREGMPRVRNATTTTIAPTGTLSIIADCSSGIEPYFALAYRRYVLDTSFLETNRFFFALAKRRGFYTEALEAEVIRRGILKGIRDVPSDLKKLFKTALEIPYAAHIRMESIFQRHTDNAVSKTVNMSARATRDDVAAAFRMAYDEGCKGITVFRAGGRKRGPLVRYVDTD